MPTFYSVIAFCMQLFLQMCSIIMNPQAHHVASAGECHQCIRIYQVYDDLM